MDIMKAGMRPGFIFQTQRLGFGPFHDIQRKKPPSVFQSSVTPTEVSRELTYPNSSLKIGHRSWISHENGEKPGIESLYSLWALFFLSYPYTLRILSYPSIQIVC